MCMGFGFLYKAILHNTWCSFYYRFQAFRVKKETETVAVPVDAQRKFHMDNNTVLAEAWKQHSMFQIESSKFAFPRMSIVWQLIGTTVFTWSYKPLQQPTHKASRFAIAGIPYELYMLLLK